MNDRPSHLPQKSKRRSTTPVDLIASTVVDIREFLLTKKQVPQKFVRQARTLALRIPSEQDIAELAKRISADAKLQERLVSLAAVLIVEPELDSLKRVISSVMEQLLCEFVPSWQTPTIGSPVEVVANAAGVIRQAVKSKHNQQLLLAVYVLTAIHKGWIIRSDTDDLVAGIFLRPVKKKTKSRKKQEDGEDRECSSGESALLPLLSKTVVLMGALEVREVCQNQIRELQKQNSLLDSENGQLVRDLQASRDMLAAAGIREKELEGQIAAIQKQVEELQKDLKAQITNSLHDRQMLKARVKGFLRGELTRWLQTAHDASTANPPRLNVIIERLDQALNLVEKEAQWTESSD